MFCVVLVCGRQSEQHTGAVLPVAPKRRRQDGRLCSARGNEGYVHAWRKPSTLIVYYTTPCDFSRCP
jgi:hypothetical protein